jgi:beta-glucosidase
LWANSPKVIDPVVSPILTINGFTFADLNKNGKLDKYEDNRLPMKDRIQDLINKMTDEEKQAC